MDSIIIGFSRPKSGFQPFSWLIRLVTWSPVSHTYVRFYSDSYKKWLIYQASGLKVNFIGLPLFKKEELIYKEYEISISNKTKLETVQFAIDKCGMPYSLIQALGILIVIGARVFGKKIKNPFYSPYTWVCSELVSSILDEIGNGTIKIDPSITTPKDLMLYLQSKGYKEVSVQ